MSSVATAAEVIDPHTSGKAAERATARPGRRVNRTGASARDLRRLLLQQAGALTWQQAVQLGLSRKAIRQRLEEGEWYECHGVLVVPADSRWGVSEEVWRADPDHRLERGAMADWRDAWCLSLRGGANSMVSGPLAMRLGGWSIDVGLDPPMQALLSTLHRHSPIRGVTVIRRCTMPRAAIVRHSRLDSDCRPVTPGLLRVASPLEGLLDTVSIAPLQCASGVLDLALQRRLVTHSQLRRACFVRGRKARRGLRQLRWLTRAVQRGGHSPAERLLATILRRAKIRGWVVDHPVHAADGAVIARLDLAFPDRMIAMEVDGYSAHSSFPTFVRDRERQNQLILDGWTVIRFTWPQLKDSPDVVVQTVRRALANVGAGRRD